MRSRCKAFQDAIWEHARFGTQLSNETQAHVDSCESCARTLKEARVMADALTHAASVPQVPDCRSAVMDRISAGQRLRRPVWVYAPAGVALASVLVGGVIATSIVREPSSDVMVKIEAPAQQIPAAPKKSSLPPAVVENQDETAESAVPGGPVNNAYQAAHATPAESPAPEPKPAKEKAPEVVLAEAPSDEMREELPEASVRGSELDTYSAAGMRAPKVSEAAASNATTATIEDWRSFKENKDAEVCAGFTSPDITTASETAKSAALGATLPAVASAAPLGAESADERPVAIAVVSWGTPPTEPEEVYSYSYSETDPGTGQVTNCTVEKTGNAVYIHLEAEPEPENRLPSERGSIGNESSTDV